MQNSGGFDHQAQSLRIVEELEERFPEHRGLNLTYEVREGIARHETEYDVANPAEYALNEAPTLEAQLTSAADEIAYSTADLDDGLRAGILDPRDLEELAVWEEWRAEKHMDMERFTDLVRHKFIRWLVNLLVSDLIAATDVNLRAFRIGSVAALRAHGKPVTAFSGTVEEKHRALKDFLYANFYRNYRVVRMAAKAERMLEALFHAYLNQPEILPPSVKARVSKLPPTRVVCDYIAGMTDRFAMNEYARLFDPETRV
jgi:dGTPase